MNELPTLSLRSLRRKRWIAWIQFLAFMGWTFSSPSLNAIYVLPSGSYSLNDASTWQPVWDGGADNEPEPSSGPDQEDTDGVGGDGLPNWFEDWYEFMHAPAGWEMGTMRGNPDSDYDGATDGDELLIMSSDPLDAYSLGMQLSDGTSVTDGQYFQWANQDGDGDGLNDWQEMTEHGTDPQDADSDDDEWNDGDELAASGAGMTYSPLNPDSDGDGLQDLDDHLVNTDPSGDYDGDGLDNQTEATTQHLTQSGSSGYTSLSRGDTDGDGLSDGYEARTERNGENKSASNPLLTQTDVGTDDGQNGNYVFPSDQPQSLSITTSGELPPGYSGSDYIAYFSAANASGSVNWSVTAGNLPASFGFEGAALVGNAASAGVYHFTVTAQDDYTASSADFTLVVTVAGVSISSSSQLSGVYVGNEVSHQFAASGGGGGYAWSSGDLPAGLSLSSEGQLTGIIHSTGDYSFTVMVVAADGTTAEQTAQLSITEEPPPPTVEVTSSPFLTDGWPGQAYSWSFSATGGTGNYSWTASSLPAGLSLDSYGYLSGTPEQSGTYEFNVTAMDGNGTSGGQSCTLHVGSIDPPTLQISHPGPLSGSAWSPFEFSLGTSAQSGTALSWSLSSAPSGIMIDPASGAISGRCAEVGTEISLEVAVTDGFSSDSATLYISSVDQDADGDGVPASKEHELALAWNLPLHDGDAFSSRGNAEEGAHDWLYYYHSELVTDDLWSDTDEDGLGSQLEQFLGTDPDLKDSDGDYKPDWWQRYLVFDRFHLIRDGDGTVIDIDGDGLPYSLEIFIGSNDDSLDSDGDGLEDEWEWNNASYADIYLSDTDADGLSDMEEYNAGTYARMADSDGDYLTDREELQGLFGITLNPLDQDSDDDGFPDWTEVDLTDSDGAGIPDRLEDFWEMDKNHSQDELGDLDGDTHTNLEAYQHGWDVRASFDPLFDRDGDRITNNYELARELDPDDKTDGADDPDGDFLTNSEEYQHHTSHILALTPATAHTVDLDSPLKQIYAPNDWGYYGLRDVLTDFEVAFGYALTSNLLRDDGPHPERQHDDDWDQDGMSNFLELYPPAGPPSNPRSYDSPLEMTPPPNMVEPGGAYNTVLMASGGMPPYQFRVKEGSVLPSWMALTGARLHGTAPAAPSTESPFDLVCQDARGTKVEMAVYMRVETPPPPFSWQTPADLGYVDVTSGAGSYSTTLSTFHGNGSVTFVSENLPAGCTLSSTGEFVGSFSNDATTGVSFTVTATDQASPPESIVRTFTLSFTPVVETLAVTPFIPPVVIPGAGYGPITVTTTGGQGAVVMSVVGSLPSGFAFDGSSFSGTAPAYLEPFAVTFRAIDSQDPPQEAFYTASFSVPSISGVPTLLGPPMITCDEPCNVRLHVIGGGWQEPYSLTLLSGDLPPGLSYNATTRMLSGTTSSYDWSSNLIFLAINGGTPSELPWTLTTSQRPIGPLKISGVNEISVVRGTFVYRTFRAYDGLRSWNYVLPSAASLPVGLSSGSQLEWDGLKAYLVGRPSEITSGWRQITISAVDDLGRRVDHPVNIRVLPPVEISDNLTVVTPGSAVSINLAASGGSGGYIWQVGTGGLPPGLTLNSSGTLTGTPSATGVSYFTLNAQDNEGNRVSRNFALESAPTTSGGNQPPPNTPPDFKLQVHSQSVTFSYEPGGEKPEEREISGTGQEQKTALLQQGWNEFDDGDGDPETWLLKKTEIVDVPPSAFYRHGETGEGTKDLKTSQEIIDIIEDDGERPKLDDVMKDSGSFKDSGFVNVSGNPTATSGSSQGFPTAQWYDFRMKASGPVQADTSFTFLKVTTPPPTVPPSPPKPTIQSITVTIPKGGTVSTKGGDKAGLISLHPHGGNKQSLLPVDLEVDSNNDGTIDGADTAVEDVESGGSIDKMGHHLQVNTFDYDADKVPDYIDGITKGGSLLASAGGNSIAGDPQRHFSKLKMTLGFSRSEYEFMFEYSADNPNNLSVSQGSNFGQKEQVGGAVENYNISAPGGSLRIWTKDADTSRKAESITASTAGDFVPANEWIAGDKMPTGDMFLEGVRTSTGWGSDKIKLKARNKTSTGTVIDLDSVSLTVSKSVLRVYVNRPYTYEAAATVKRPQLVIDYSTPRNANTSVFNAMHPDRHDTAPASRGSVNWYGHGFWCASYAGPGDTTIMTANDTGSDGTKEYWSGKTSGPGGASVESARRTHLKEGKVFWFAEPGLEHGKRPEVGTYQTLASPSIRTPHGEDMKIVAWHDFILPPKLLQKICTYPGRHDFSKYGLDLGATEGGCASYVGLTFKDVGMNEHLQWEVRQHLTTSHGVANLFPVVQIPGWDWFWAWSEEAVITLARDNFIATPGTDTWGGYTPAWQLNFYDPGLLAKWMDELRRTNKRTSTIYNKMPSTP